MGDRSEESEAEVDLREIINRKGKKNIERYAIVVHVICMYILS